MPEEAIEVSLLRELNGGPRVLPNSRVIAALSDTNPEIVNCALVIARRRGMQLVVLVKE